MKIIYGILNTLSFGLYDLVKKKKIYKLWQMSLIFLVVCQYFSYFNNIDVYVLTNFCLFIILILMFLSPFLFEKRISIKGQIKVSILIHVCLMFNILLVEEKITLATNQGNSMLPTIKNEQVLVLRKLDESINISRGDIVAFYLNNKLYIKRVFSISGDRVTVKYGFICNQLKCLEDKKSKDINEIEFGVPDNSFFVLGDNLSNSEDSRYFTDTFVKREDIYYVYLGALI